MCCSQHRPVWTHEAERREGQRRSHGNEVGTRPASCVRVRGRCQTRRRPYGRADPRPSLRHNPAATLAAQNGANGAIQHEEALTASDTKIARQLVRFVVCSLHATLSVRGTAKLAQPDRGKPRTTNENILIATAGERGRRCARDAPSAPAVSDTTTDPKQHERQPINTSDTQEKCTREQGTYHARKQLWPLKRRAYRYPAA